MKKILIVGMMICLYAQIEAVAQGCSSSGNPTLCPRYSVIAKGSGLFCKKNSTKISVTFISHNIDSGPIITIAISGPNFTMPEFKDRPHLPENGSITYEFPVPAEGLYTVTTTNSLFLPACIYTCSVPVKRTGCALFSMCCCE